MFEPCYMLLLEHIDGNVKLAKNDNHHMVIAQEGNQYLLEYMGKRLLGKKLISGYQILKTVTPPIRNLEFISAQHANDFREDATSTLDRWDQKLKAFALRFRIVRWLCTSPRSMV